MVNVDGRVSHGPTIRIPDGDVRIHGLGQHLDAQLVP